MARKRRALKCLGHRMDGEKCNAWAINGGIVCAAHAGRVNQVKAAARRLAERKAEATLAAITDYEPRN